MAALSPLLGTVQPDRHASARSSGTSRPAPPRRPHPRPLGRPAPRAARAGPRGGPAPRAAARGAYPARAAARAAPAGRRRRRARRAPRPTPGPPPPGRLVSPRVHSTGQDRRPSFQVPFRSTGVRLYGTLNSALDEEAEDLP